ncbi:Dol-P-Man:Man(6)GlcNAc(2)-PP-Dol alpha-1,2-mannosyltransferase [Citrus sinensis]|uniref:Dol-P-Man:Man(6)GlcNAc(2)-PP-Dol alpha-1,2-mannosyltransferase n=1 Tax=Citrus sinensis TaxID=2711 RepID=A0ACB8LZL6_CITSI|nr:Dol-P-Man:Man(6)GlcNAc(2)-PP-Dol alpha-1,2-mannosyltransferase [Citrus sinensis]
MALTTRQRRPLPSDPPPSSPIYTKYDKPSRRLGDGGREEEKSLGWFVPVFALGMLRYMSATTNIIHDCDEVFNYWEPLHYLLYKSGFQTWEYSSEFALRSYLYILFHELVGRPASWLFAEDKVRVFYAVRLFLGLLSVTTDAVLVVALSRKYGRRLASYTLAMLCLTSGCFFASTSFLPSSFSMYAISLASGFFLLEKYAMAVAVSAAGVILGWPFSILAFLPVVFYSLARRFKQAFLAGAATSVTLLALSVFVDYQYYRRWTSSVLNLVVYNVVGGGESHLYGIEGPLYYLRNAFNNFNFGFVLALLFVGILPIARKKYAPGSGRMFRWERGCLKAKVPSKVKMMVWAVAHRNINTTDINQKRRPSMGLSHDWFLYPIYPLICVAASAVIESFPDIFRDKYDPNANFVMVTTAKVLRPFVLGLILCASHSRTFSLVNGYAAPIEVYKILQHHDDAGPGSVVCVGSEWHRYPSSFFIPNYIGEVRWLDDGFRGLLPLPFNSTVGGTSAAPSYFNNKNKASDQQFLQDVEACTFLVELQLNRPYPSRGSDLSKWEPIAALPYLDREFSPPLYRSFFIPYLWQQRNVFGLYKLFRRIRN